MTHKGRYSWRRELREARDAEGRELVVQRVHCPSCGAWLAAVDQFGRLYDVRRGVDYPRKYVLVRCRECRKEWGLTLGRNGTQIIPL